MRPNGSTKDGSTVTPEQKQGRLVFARMSRYIGRLSKGSMSEDVHRFRTNGRRVEALITELLPATGNQKKLLKLLSKLRKRAGRVRDLDVELAFLKNLRIPDRQNHRTQLLEILTEEHHRRSRKLAKNFDADRIRELRKRLRRAQAEIKLEGIEPLKLAFKRLPKPGEAPMTEKNLSEAKAFVEELKRAQDEVGEWHDVLKLQQRAERLFGTVRDSALVAALQNISRARFRRAVNAMTTAVASLSEPQTAAASPIAGKKAGATEPTTTSAAA